MNTQLNMKTSEPSENNNLFLKSALSREGSFLKSTEVIGWLQKQNDSAKVKIEKIRFDQLKSWSIGPDGLAHKSGKFFSIEGIQVSTNWGNVFSWNQPIINQSEIGYLGFITREYDGILHFLMQAKIEPGNIYMQSC